MQNGKFDIVNGKTKPLFLRYCIPNVLGILALSSAQLIDAFLSATTPVQLLWLQLILSCRYSLCLWGWELCFVPAAALSALNLLVKKTILTHRRFSAKLFSATLCCGLLVTPLGISMPHQIVGFFRGQMPN